MTNDDDDDDDDDYDGNGNERSTLGRIIAEENKSMRKSYIPAVVCGSASMY